MSNLNPVMAMCLRPFAPPQSEVHKLAATADLTMAQRQQIDDALLEDKACDGYGQRAYRAAMADQMRAE